MPQLIAPLQDATPGKMIDFEIDGIPAMLVNDGGELRAFLNMCPHQGGRMELKRENGILSCGWHAGIWSLRGARLAGPAADKICLIPVNIFVEGGCVYAR